MKLVYKYRHVDPPRDIEDYVVAHLDKITRYELKPARAECTFSAEKTRARVDLHVRGEGIDLHAHGVAEDFRAGVDLALEKMARQLVRAKARIQKRSA